ncbi:hypothetical protein JTB14_034649 [Gonioctena quinquepunctata]|nr:hypothetical protein JTB14_034649 [Gonioctena quinquepunctata]
MKKEGAVVLPMVDLVEVASIVQAYKMLTCPESLVHDTATSQLREVTQRRIERHPSTMDLARYLSGDLTEKFFRDGGDISSLRSRARNATRRLSKRLDVKWLAYDYTLFIQRDNSSGTFTIAPSIRQHLEW